MSSKRKNVKNFTDIGTVLQNILPQYRRTAPPSLLRVWEKWDQAVGADIAAHARPVAFKGDLLLIHVANSTWLHHLRYMQEDILIRINQSIGEQRIHELKFKIGPV